MNGVSDTIAAVATAPGRGGVGIVRISGPAVMDIAQGIIGCLPRARQATHKIFVDADGQALDDGIALYFPAPHSFTGEHVLELQGHGGAVVLDLLLQRVLALGARLARAGEFSERAFLNDKLDLAQAEAIADLIDSGSAQAARSALRSLQGVFSAQIDALIEQLIALRVYVEAALDFPDEDIDFLADQGLHTRLQSIQQALQQTRAMAYQGSLLREGMTLVIVGQPNAGKSTLLNALAGRDLAIVTDVPGTTRDVLRESIQIDGLPLHVLDTAGLRESTDPVELEGIRRAWQAAEQADAIVLLLDAQQGECAQDRAILARLNTHLPVITVHNKIDLSADKPGCVNDEVYLSAKTGAGVVDLQRRLKQLMRFEGEGEGVFMARRRHVKALDDAHKHVQEAAAQLKTFHAGELMAEELRLAQERLGEITGVFTSDDLLGEIFSSFCIGK